MAGHVRYTALLDACVLYPLVTCDALLSLATAGLFAAKWSEQIDQEWISNLEVKRPNLKGRLNDRRDAMREAIPDWEVPNVAIDALVPCLNLPDPDDAHVLAAAIAGHADCIVTANLRDFPASVVAPFGIEVMHPERFILSQWELAPYPTIAAFKRMRKRWRRPSAEPEDFARAFDRGGLPAVAGRIREASEII